MDINQVKQRFGILGNHPSLNRALEVAVQVATTDISVLVTGESGTGKETIPKIIHQLSPRKHGEYIAVNCGAIPEGTIDSELFGHEKGSFTGANASRKGYFEVANNGTIFLDEVAELPMQTQVRLLRVLETGEFMRVGASKPEKTNVRVVAATNENMMQAIKKGKFREDLLYRLSIVPIHLPPLRERKEDIHLLFRKFANDFGEKYRMPPIRLTDEAVQLLIQNNWPGNIRQLKNVVEQISVIEHTREIDGAKIQLYLPQNMESLPYLGREDEVMSERELMYKVLFDMKRDLTDLKKLVLDLATNSGNSNLDQKQTDALNRLMRDVTNVPNEALLLESKASATSPIQVAPSDYEHDSFEEVETILEAEESLSIEDKEKELIEKALEKYRGKRKYAAQELGISERTLYRKIKEYNLQG
jgi:transcriptional regulator with PAS, ATPase and Fis domain